MQKLPKNEMVYLLRMIEASEKIRNDIPNLIYDLTVIVRKNLESKIFDASEFELSKTSQYLKHIRFDEI